MHAQGVPHIIEEEAGSSGEGLCTRVTIVFIPRSSAGADERLPWAGSQDLVVTRGTPPQEEGCRPASRGLSLILETVSLR